MPTYYSQPELISDTIEFEYRNKVLIVVTTGFYVFKTPQKRSVRTKTYECSVVENPAVAELPAPSYVAGDNYIQLNPESLSPVGNDTGSWHCDEVVYEKTQSEPYTRKMRFVWVKNGGWTDYDGSNSQ
jgi:hypothetical protein